MNYLCSATGSRQSTAALFSGVAAILIILTVQSFQHIGGYIPCLLCYLQREPYYIAIPALMIAWWSATRGGQPVVTRGFLTIATLCFTATAAMGGFHSGVEWGWWAGPVDCGVGAQVDTKDASNLLNQLQAIKPPSCNEAAGRFLGLSFAGWNVVAAVGLTFIAGRGACGRANS